MTSHLKKTAVNILLTAVFCLLVVVIARPFLAELTFITGKKLVKEYKWPQAEAEFRKAISMDPFSSRYAAELGDFLVAQSGYQGHKEPFLKEAEKLFRRAIELDPRNAECWLGLGLIELNRKAYDKAFENFRTAIENDPNGFNITYPIGSAGLGVWKNISEANRAFVVSRAKAAMTARPSIDIYAKAWSAQKDIGLLRAITPDSLEGQQLLYGFIVSRNLWQFRKAQAERLDHYIRNEAPDSLSAEKAKKAKLLKKAKDRYGRQAGTQRVISGSDWHGSTPDGKSAYENGSMYWSGTMDAAVDMPEGSVTVRIRAKGQPADRVYPYMIVELEGEEIGESFVDSPEWKDYEFQANTTGGVKVVSVTFANDGGNAKEDRNLYVGTAEILKNGR